MSKQLDIREGIAGLINLSISEDTKRTISNAIMLYLHREGVVIKVDSKLHIMHRDGLKIARLVKDAGYVAVGSLIDTP